jgi:hypothetical protein
MLPNEYAVSPNLAAALTGRSDKHIRKLIADGVLPASGGNRPKVTLADLAVIRGREISAEEFMAAVCEAERRRGYWRDYQAHRRRWALEIGEQSGAVPQPT